MNDVDLTFEWKKKEVLFKIQKQPVLHIHGKLIKLLNLYECVYFDASFTNIKQIESPLFFVWNQNLWFKTILNWINCKNYVFVFSFKQINK